MLHLNRISNALHKADLILEQFDGVDQDFVGPPFPGYEVPTSPGVTDTAMSTHGYHFPPWLLPPAGGQYNDHPMYGVYQVFWDQLLGQDWFGLESAGKKILSFGNFLSMLRFLYRPHIPNTLFDRMDAIGFDVRLWMELFGPSGWDQEFIQNTIRDLLRSWMLDNLDYPAEILERMFPHLFAPAVGVGQKPEAGVKPIGDGGVIQPQGPPQTPSYLNALQRLNADPRWQAIQSKP